MSTLPELTQPPRVEWHEGRPFAFAQLSPDYTRRLEQLAHHHRPSLLHLEPAHDAVTTAANPTASRYPGYNVFLLDGAYLPLFLAIRETYRALVHAFDGERPGRFIKCWYNITEPGEHMARHRHQAVFIGTFVARSEGCVTRFGTHPEPQPGDYRVNNRDGQLLLTVGMNHYHDVIASPDARTPRVTYAFDIVNAGQWRADRVQVPFDGDFA